MYRACRILYIVYNIIDLLSKTMPILGFPNAAQYASCDTSWPAYVI